MTFRPTFRPFSRKLTLLVPVVLSAVLLLGCNGGHEKIGDAPRTEKAANAAGWKEISTSGIAIQLPSDWKTMDLSRQNFEEGADKVFGSDSKFAALRSQASAMAKQGLVKLVAFDTSTIGTGFATNCNVVTQDLPGPGNLEQIATATVKQIAPAVAAGTQPQLTYITTKAGKVARIRSEIKTANTSMPALASMAYLAVNRSKLFAVTFTTPKSDEARLKPVAEQAIDTLRFTE